MIRLYLILLAFCCINSIHAQERIKPSEVVQNLAIKKIPQKINLLKVSKQTHKKLDAVLDSYVMVDYNQDAMLLMKETEQEFLEIEIPISTSEKLTLQLVETDLFDDNNYVNTLPSNTIVNVSTGKHYRGIIKGKPETLVALSIFDDEIMGLVSGIYGSNLVIGKIKGDSKHVVYIDQQIAKHQDFDCGTQDDNISYTESDVSYQAATSSSLNNNCVRLYIEVNNDVYRNKGSENATSNFILGLMNQVMTMYANENIQTKLMPLNIWTQSSPYTGYSTQQILNQFQNTRTNWDGDLAQLIGYAANDGIAAGFDGICNYNRRVSMSYSGIQSYYNVVPTFSWTAHVVTHEFGHLFGSRHTHACVWNGNGTAIDGCAGFTEGNCYVPGNPSAGGTTMSYCHRTSVGTNMSLGFGTQPGNVIRNRVYNASCLQSCGGVDPDPDPNPGCNNNEVVVSIKTDQYPKETSWSIYNANGVEVVSGGDYTSSNTTYNKTACLPDGCYTFEIFDEYADGICCAYGNGSYSVKFDGITLVSGGTFTNEEQQDFCVPNNVVDPDPVEPSCINTTILLKTDNYASEISWELKNANNQIVETGENYTNNNYEYTLNSCLEPGCYTLTMSDEYGDGFCCSYGRGWYEFKEEGEVKLSEWADFRTQISHNICIGSQGNAGATHIIRDEIPPFTTQFNVISPFKEVLNLKFDKVKENIHIGELVIVNLDGRLIYTEKNIDVNQMISINTTSWSKGMYVLTLSNGNQKKSMKIIKK